MGSLDPDPGGKKWPTKIEQSSLISYFEVLYVLFWGLKASSVAWTSFKEAFGLVNWNFEKKIYIFFQLYFLSFWSSKLWIRISIRIHLICWIRILWFRIPKTGYCFRVAASLWPVFWSVSCRSVINWPLGSGFVILNNRSGSLLFFKDSEKITKNFNILY